MRLLQVSDEGVSLPGKKNEALKTDVIKSNEREGNNKNHHHPPSLESLEILIP